MKIIDEGVDFTYFRIIGYNINFNIYVEDRNLSKYDHWLYGPCNNENDTVGISHLIKYDFFEKSACIKKYFNSKEQKYFDTFNPNFKYPEMAHGTYNADKKLYVISIEKCEKETLKEILGHRHHCKNIDEINEFIGQNSGAHLYFIDHYVDD